MIPHRLANSVQSNVAAGIHIFRFDNENMQIRVDHIVEEKRILHAELTVYSYAPQLRDWLMVSRESLNLLSATTRKRTAKLLSERMEWIPLWGNIIEELALEVVNRQREGEPAIQVKDIPEPESIEWRLEPVLIEKAPTLVYGFGGAGKSILAAYWATVISEGYTGYGLEPEPGEVLYLDYESTEADFRRRVDAVHRGMEMDTKSDIYYRRCSQKLGADVQEIQRIVLEKKIQVVMVDTAGPACGGDPENAASSIQFFMALRSLNVTSLILAHKSKAKESRGPFGSVYWENYPRNVFYLKSDMEPGADTVHLGMTHEKANEGLRQNLQVMALQFADNGRIATFKPVDASEIPAFEADQSSKARLLQELRGGKQTALELAESLDLSRRKVYDTLRYGQRSGIFDMAENKKWYLPA